MYTFNEVGEIINKALFNQNFKLGPKELYEPMEYVIFSGGKRLRPCLVIMGCNMFSDSVENAIKPAIGIELFHNFTLLHDDIMDNAEIRRNQKTVHKKWNNNVAILSGDAMAIKAYQYIGDCDQDKIKDVLKMFNQTAFEVCEGQQYDMNFETRQYVPVEEYIEMIGLKTSVLIAASLHIGAIIGGAGKDDASLIYDFGKNLGLAFQLQDDLLDVYGDPKIFGKNTGGDISSNKKTFLLIKAFEKATGETLAELKQYILTKNFDANKKIEAVKQIYDQLAIKETTEEEINKYFKQALENLEKISVKSSRKEELKNLAEEMIKRIK